MKFTVYCIEKGLPDNQAIWIDFLNRMKKRLNLTYFMISNVSGIPERTLQNWFKGFRVPSLYVLKMLAYVIEKEYLE